VVNSSWKGATHLSKCPRFTRLKAARDDESEDLLTFKALRRLLARALNGLQYAGAGVYAGIAGAIMMAAAYFLKPSRPQQAATPPPPPPQYAPTG